MNAETTVTIQLAPLRTDMARWLSEQNDVTQALFLREFIAGLDDCCGGPSYAACQLSAMFAELRPDLRQRIKEAIE